MKLKEIKIGIVLSYLQILLSIVIELIYTPVVIRLLGKSEYGLYNTAISTISALSILNLGFNSSYIRYYAKYKEEKKYDKIYNLNGMFFTIFLLMGFVAFIIGIYLIFNINIIFNKGLNEQEYKIFKVLLSFLIISLFYNFPISIFENIISAHEKYIFLKTVEVFRIILNPILTIPLLLLGFKSIALVAISLIILLITSFIHIYYVFFILKEKFCFRFFEKKLLKDMLIYTSFIAINIIVDQINNNIDNILLARIRGTNEVALYAISSRLYTVFVRFSVAISGVFIPTIHSIANKIKDKKNLAKEYTGLFIKVGRLQFILLGLFISGTIFFGKRFILLWAGKDYVTSYYILLLLIIPTTIPLIQNLGIEIQRAENKHQFRSIIYLIMAIFNLFLSYSLCKKYGAIGTTIGTSISLIFANGILMNIFYHKKCYINILEFWKNIISVIRGMIIPCFLGIILNIYIEKNNMIYLYIFSILIYTIIYVISIWKISMNEEEKLFLKNIYIKIKNKREEVV